MSLTTEQRGHLEKRLHEERARALYKSPAQFGLCDDGREIPFERLDIIPWARTCD